MEHEFVFCPHCGALNFKDARSCYDCTFRLPVDEKKESRSITMSSKHLIICITILSIATLLVLALTLSSKTDDEIPENVKTMTTAISGN